MSPTDKYQILDEYSFLLALWLFCDFRGYSVVMPAYRFTKGKRRVDRWVWQKSGHALRNINRLVTIIFVNDQYWSPPFIFSYFNTKTPPLHPSPSFCFYNIIISSSSMFNLSLDDLSLGSYTLINLYPWPWATVFLDHCNDVTMLPYGLNTTKIWALSP